MMVYDQWIPRKFKVKAKIVAVEYENSEHTNKIHFTEIKQSKNKITIESKGSLLNFQTLPFANLKKDTPIVLVVNGASVIIKRIPVPEEEEVNPASLIKEHFPAIHEEDFYIQISGKSNYAYIALCRRDFLTQIIEACKTNKLEIIDVIIGVPAVMNVLNFFTNAVEFYSSTHLINVEDRELKGAVKRNLAEAEKEKYLEIGELCVEPDYVLAASAGLGYLMNENTITFNDTTLAGYMKKHLEKNKLYFLATAAISFMLLVALVNAVTYMMLFDNNRQLETELAVHGEKYDKISDVLSDYAANKVLIENTGLLDAGKISEYADKIAMTVPDGITLDELYFNPKISNDDYADSMMTFKKDNIIIKGKCTKSFTVNEWLNSLKHQNFINEVSLQKFIYRDNDGFSPNFEIKLTTK